MASLTFSDEKTVDYGASNPIELNHSPALAVFQGRLVAGYFEAASNSYAYTSTYTVGDTYWSNPQPVRTQQTVATADDVLHFILRWDGENKLYSYECTDYYTWGDEEKLSSDDGFKSNHEAAITMYRGDLYMVYKGKDDNKLYWATYDVDSGWSDEQSITAENDAKASRSPAMAVFQGLLYLVYKGKDEKKLHWCTYDGSSWSDIKSITKRNGAKTDTSPALAVYNDLLYLAYKKVDASKLKLCSFDGDADSWSDPINMTDETDAKTDHAPAMVVYQGQVFVAFHNKTNAKLKYFTFYTP